MASAPTTALAHTDLPTLLSELRQVRARAERVLAEIRQAQQHRDQASSAEASKTGTGGETFRRIAGTSCLERAASDAERVIAAVDRRLSEIAATSHVSTSMTDWVRGR